MMKMKKKRDKMLTRVLDNAASRFGSRNFSPLSEDGALAWLRLIRLPNLFTVFGDPLAGAGVASALTGAEMSLLTMVDICFCSILLYCFGVIQNDWCDLAEDRRRRPERPLPSKRIPVLSAAIVCICCAVVALVLAALTGRQTFIMAGVIVALSSAYNMVLKKALLPGAVGMGLCRGFNLLLGASAVGITPAIFIPFAALVFYIACVTWLADGENRKQIPNKNVLLPCLAFLVGWCALVPFAVFSKGYAGGFLASVACISAAVIGTFSFGTRIYNKSVQPPQMRSFIGSLICCLVPWQAALLCFGLPGNGLWIIILGAFAWLAAVLLGKTMQQS